MAESRKLVKIQTVGTIAGGWAVVPGCNEGGMFISNSICVSMFDSSIELFYIFLTRLIFLLFLGVTIGGSAEIE